MAKMMLSNAGKFMRHQGSSCSSADSSSEDGDASDGDVATSCAVATSCPILDFSPTLSITRRSGNFGAMQIPVVYTNIRCGHNWQNCHNISDLQILSEEHSEKLLSLFPIPVWKILGTVLDQSKTTQTEVLTAVATLLNARERKLWPATRQVIDNKLAKFGCIRVLVRRQST